jgi:hypothetical protein
MRFVLLWGTVVSFGLGSFVAIAAAQDKDPGDDPVVQDLKLLQGKWELLHGNEGRGAPTLHSVKEIEGNRETLRRYDAQSGKLLREHTAEFTLTRSGDVRVFTFFQVGGNPKQGQSFVYKVDAENFYDIPGLLQGETYRNYQESPTVWRWSKVKEGVKPKLPKVPEPLREIEPALLKALEASGARVYPKADGYAIDVRRKLFFADKELDLVVQCPQVVDLTMEGVSVTDKGLEKLRALEKLNRLILNDCSISAGGLKILAELPLRESLLSIGLRGTKIKNDDLTWLKGFAKLERVDASQTAVTDASLPPLEALPLKVLNVAGTKMTAAGLEPLQKKNPKLIVNK